MLIGKLRKHKPIMNRTLEKVLNPTTTPDNLFGVLTEAERKYKNLLRRCHPDMYDTPEDKTVANQAFIRLNVLWEAYNRHTGTPGVSSTPVNTIKTRRHEYRVVGKRWETRTSTTLEATYDDGHKTTHIMLPKNQADNDLHLDGYRTLQEVKKQTPPEYQAYYPDVLERFKTKTSTQTLQATALAIPEGMYTLQEALEDYPGGLNPKDVAWIFRRILIALDLTHKTGNIYGAPTLDNILIHPAQHGLTLHQWAYTVPVGQKLNTVPPENRNDYPTQALTGTPVTHAVDVHVAANTMLTLGGNRTPKRMLSFYRGCQLNNVPTAGELLQEYDDLLKQMWGTRTFHPFAMKRA